MASLKEKISDFLFQPIHPAVLGFFRIVVGAVFIYEAWDSWARYYATEALTNAEFRLTYDFFHWVQPLSPERMNMLWNLMGIASVMAILGIFTRYAFGIIALVWTYSWLLCNSMYNNHYYLMSLIAIFFIFVQSENWMSLRNVIFPKHPHKGKSIPNWHLFIFKFQIFLVYLFGAFAKMNKDWMNGFPMKMWLPNKQLGPLTEFVQSDAGAMFFSYSGLLFDLFIGPMLFFRKTRWLAIPMIIAFHISNHFLWNIGVFPWFMLGATLIYFRPDWPERFVQFIQNLGGRAAKNAGSLPRRFKAAWQGINIHPPELSPITPKRKKWIMGVLGVYFAFQMLYPARQAVFKGDSAWTGEGFFFSWNMMLVDRPYIKRFKVVFPGRAPQWLDLHCYTIDRNREMYPCNGYKGHLYTSQWRKMGHYPKHYIRYAQFLADDFEKKGLPRPEIYAHVFRQLNNRPYQLVMDSTVNLVDVKYSSWARNDLVMPFEDLPYKTDMDAISEEEMEVFGLTGN